MYIEHPYFYEGKYYANIDGEMIEISSISQTGGKSLSCLYRKCKSENKVCKQWSIF